VVTGTGHFGPGQEKLLLDDIGKLLEQAEDAEEVGDWGVALEAYGQVLAELPKDAVDEALQVRLAQAKAQMKVSQLPSAYRDLRGLLDDLTADPSAEPDLVADARSTLASAQYYMTWLMRLEGQPREDWEPVIEASRQNYRLLAQNAEKAGAGNRAETHKKDLESSIRLARMDLGELQGLPLPSQ